MLYTTRSDMIDWEEECEGFQLCRLISISCYNMHRFL